jgi:hypothetical protein
VAVIFAAKKAARAVDEEPLHDVSICFRTQSLSEWMRPDAECPNRIRRAFRKEGGTW